MLNTMIMQLRYFVFILFIIPRALPAQNPIFLDQGKIRFEKKTNLYDQMQEDGNDNSSWTELAKKAMPHFKIEYFDLLFTKNKTLYQAGPANPDNDKIPDWYALPENKAVYSDLGNEKTIIQKSIFEDLFLVQDSTRKIRWKITDETRTIAGFSCRRANALVMDSVYVVAFYTDEIPTTGGPESFCGLPGMILGVAIPHQHISWFATGVQAVPVSETDFKIPSKGKKNTRKELNATLSERIKDWGKSGRRYLLLTMI